MNGTNSSASYSACAGIPFFSRPLSIAEASGLSAALAAVFYERLS
jgi:hypothetical protein